MNQNQKIVIVLIVLFLAGIGIYNFNFAGSLGDRLNAAESKVSELQGSSVTHVTKEQVKAVLDEELASGGQVDKVLAAFGQQISEARDAAINTALASIKETILDLDATVNSTTADGLKTALAKLEEGQKRHNAVIYGKERGIVTAITSLAERHNEAHAVATVNPADAAALRAAEARAELDANSRKALSPFEHMLAAVKGLSAMQYKEQKKIAVASNDRVPVPPIIRITVNGEKVKVERIDPPKLRHVPLPQ